MISKVIKLVKVKLVKVKLVKFLLFLFRICAFVVSIPLFGEYTVGHKRCHFYFYDNFDKCGPISIILSLLDS